MKICLLNIHLKAFVRNFSLPKIFEEYVSQQKDCQQQAIVPNLLVRNF